MCTIQKCLAVVLVQALALNLLAELAAQRPSNDDFAAAYRIEGTNYVGLWDNSLATTEPGEPSFDYNPQGRTLWFSWVAPEQGLVTLVGANIFNCAMFRGSTVATLQKLPGTYLVRTEPGEMFYIRLPRQSH